MNTIRVTRRVLASVTATIPALILATAASPSARSAEVAIPPGTSIQSVVDKNPEGTTFLLMSGVHRRQTVSPKNGDTFTGETGAVMSGAIVLDSFLREGSLYYAPNQTQQLPLSVGICDTTHPLCLYNEDLYFDGRALTRVSSKAAVQPGTWYFDYDGHNIYFADDPAGHTVETSVTQYAFLGTAANVTIQNLTIEKYATPAHRGTVGAAETEEETPVTSGWTMANNSIGWNHGLGIHLGDGAKVLNNYIHHNGQMGLNIEGGSNQLIEGNDIAFNNWAGFFTSWEAGGTKFAYTHNLTVRGNYVHDNAGGGLWSDTDNVNTLYEGNRVLNNATAGISHEDGYACIIRNNISQWNGQGNVWLWNAQIQIQNAQQCEVYGNTVIAGAAGGHGIGVYYQNRGNGAYGPYDTSSNYVHDNDITYQIATNASGAVADFNNATFFGSMNNRFDYNHYHAQNLNDHHWAWFDGWWSWSEFQAKGIEVHGTADTNVK